jgi:flagellar motor switch protein FliM
MGVDSFLSLNTARVDALKGTILMTIPPRLVSTLVNTFFGGNGDSPVTRASEFTPTEERVIQIVVDGSLRALEDAWRDIYPVSFEFMTSEMNPAFTSFVEGSDQVVVCSFVVQLPFANPATIDILYPLQVLKQVAPLLRSKIQRVGDGRDEAWERKLREGLMAVELNFSPRLAEPMTNIGELLNIKVGSVVEIPAFEQVKIYVEGQSLFNATIGERDGKMAVRIAG